MGGGRTLGWCQGGREDDVGVVGLIREFWPVGFLPLGFFIGSMLDRHFDSQLTSYRNKSRIFVSGQELRWAEEGLCTMEDSHDMSTEMT
uniref:Uncharacterized protein n=1 Tax=Eptatretus burgeri TaxID=7764 RepID=A0A8C4N661_EPTBU